VDGDSGGRAGGGHIVARGAGLGGPGSKFQKGKQAPKRGTRGGKAPKWPRRGQKTTRLGGGGPPPGVPLGGAQPGVARGG